MVRLVDEAKLLIRLCKSNYPNIVSKRYFLKKLFGWVRGGGDEEPPCGPLLTPGTRIETQGMSMPIIGVGTWQVVPDCMETVISYALDVGYRHIDTSHSFGNQAAIGVALDKLFKSGKYCRNDVFISAKLPYYGMKPELVCGFVKDALAALCLDYLDLFMVHFPVGIINQEGVYKADIETNHIQIWKALEEEVTKGTVKSLGLSNFNVRQIRALLECVTIRPANVQVEMHLYLQQRDLRDYLSKQCISLTAYAPLGSPGLDEYLMKNCLQSARVPQPLNDYSVSMIACKHRKTPAQVILRFLLQNGVAVIPKSAIPDRLYKNFDVFCFELNGCEMDELCGKDLGESGRMFGSNVWVGIDQHPEFPFPPTN